MLDFLLNWGYIGLFVASFLAATILPFSSEVVFAGLIAAGLDIWICIIVATIGNSLGGMTAYWVGSLGKIEWIEKYFGIKREKMIKHTNGYKEKAHDGFFCFCSRYRRCHNGCIAHAGQFLESCDFYDHRQIFTIHCRWFWNRTNFIVFLKKNYVDYFIS